MLRRFVGTTQTNRVIPRCFHATSQLSMGLEEFRETKELREQRQTQLVGRSWTVQELRRKSFDDLHKLWIVLYKEKNMILTEMHHARRNGLGFPQPERKQKVKKSMGAIKTVLGERKREKLAQLALRKLEQQQNLSGEEEEKEVTKS